MSNLMERIAGERKRLRQVREALTAAVNQGAAGDAAFVAFYIAIANYFEATMDRLHIQDVRMGDMIRDKADMTDPDNQRALAELADRLTGNHEHLDKMLAARGSLQASGAEALAEFESAGGAYSAFIVANMGHHPGTTNLAQALFSNDDWTYMAEVSEADQIREQQLFDEVFAKVPNALQLDVKQPAG